MKIEQQKSLSQSSHNAIRFHDFMQDHSFMFKAKCSEINTCLGKLVCLCNKFNQSQKHTISMQQQPFWFNLQNIVS